MTQDGGSTRDSSGSITLLNPERGGEDLDSGGIPRRPDRTGGHQETITVPRYREKLGQPGGLHRHAPKEAKSERPVVKEAGMEDRGDDLESRDGSWGPDRIAAHQGTTAAPGDGEELGTWCTDEFGESGWGGN
ncbi:hypothetical protein NDU88_007064 [Pleurodeles waltl]|uniref:Uncharacterized protein n=1 Tax=Pleurodeles waltl TaxID=8319 RepID=A0AAV7PP66_PLEWA|nr:hypothetical protein NDU88_007064 [Pleurodeles waltl]